MNVQQIGPVRFTTEITSIYHSYDATLSSINTFSAARGPSSGTWKDHARENTLRGLFFAVFECPSIRNAFVFESCEICIILIQKQVLMTETFGK